MQTSYCNWKSNFSTCLMWSDYFSSLLAAKEQGTWITQGSQILGGFIMRKKDVYLHIQCSFPYNLIWTCPTKAWKILLVLRILFTDVPSLWIFQAFFLLKVLLHSHHPHLVWMTMCQQYFSLLRSKPFIHLCVLM